MTPEPLISVIIPTYNRSSILFNTIKKVFNQTWENIQLIIVDDYSSDDTKKTIQSINDGRIKYRRTERNLGCAGARSLGVKSSKGEFITFLDDDDEWKNNYLKNQLQVFNEYPFLDFVICDYQVQNSKGSRQFYNMKLFSKNFKQMIHKRPGPFFQSCMFRSKILEDIEDLLDSNAIPSEDWDFFINLSMRNPSIGHSHKIDFKWNYSKSSQSANLIMEAKSLQYIVQKHKKSILQICGRIILSEHYRRIARIYERINDLSSVNKYYRKAFISAPWWWKNIFYMLLLAFGPKIGLQFISLVRNLRNNNE